MKVEKLLKKLASWFGVQFLPDNTILPIFWWWGRYRETRVPNHLGIVFTIPLLEKYDQPIEGGFRMATVESASLYSRDCIPLTIKLSLLYCFDPMSLRGRWAIGAQMVRLPEHRLQQIVTNQAVRHLRCIVSNFTAEKVLKGPIQKRIERWLVACLKEQLSMMGLSLLDGNGAQITDIQVSEEFERTKLETNRLQSYAQTIHNCDERVVDQALDAEAVFRAGGRAAMLLNWSRTNGGNGAVKDLSPLELTSLLYKQDDGS